MQYQMNKVLKASLMGVALLLASGPKTSPAMASETWDELKSLIYKNQIITPSRGEIKLNTPYRAIDDRRVPIGVNVSVKPDVTIKKITLIIDENPMPVSATFDIRKSSNTLQFTMPMRLNGPSTVRAIVETSDGKLSSMTEKFIKTSGTGACAAPPIGNPDELLAKMGKMELTNQIINKDLKATSLKRRANLKIQHPNLTGLQMDQITLRYILARFVKKIEVSQSGKSLFAMTGGISLSENPELTFDYKINEGNELTVRVVDTKETVFEKSFPVGAGS